MNVWVYFDDRNRKSNEDKHRKRATRRKNKKKRTEIKSTDIYRRERETRVQAHVGQPTGDEGQRTSKKLVPSL